MTWVLIIAIGGFSGVSDVRSIAMTEPQCRAALVALQPLRRQIGAVCVGPLGQLVEWGDE